MKGFITACAAAVLLVSCQETKKEGNLHLTGHVKGLGKGKLYIKKLSKTQMITHQMVDNISILRNRCRIDLKDGKKIHIPGELNDFKEFKLNLAKFYSKPSALRPYLGTQQVFTERRKEKR